MTTTLEDVHEAIQKLLPEDAILVGHSLNCDLHAMKVSQAKVSLFCWYLSLVSMILDDSSLRN